MDAEEFTDFVASQWSSSMKDPLRAMVNNLSQPNESKLVVTKATREALTPNRWAKQLQTLQRELEYLINSTPTGKARNSLTDANIHLMLAERLKIDEDKQP